MADAHIIPYIFFEYYFNTSLYYTIPVIEYMHHFDEPQHLTKNIHFLFIPHVQYNIFTIEVHIS